MSNEEIEAVRVGSLLKYTHPRSQGEIRAGEWDLGIVTKIEGRGGSRNYYCVWDRDHSNGVSYDPGSTETSQSLSLSSYELVQVADP